MTIDWRSLEDQTLHPGGKVTLVGAGPGSASLLTLRGKECLERAEVAFVDRLVGSELLHFLPSTCEVVDVGKREGHHPVPQQTINRWIEQAARAGLEVVRLKGGDPYIFGRGGEELEGLLARGIPFEVVPGITSSIACASYAGIPLTHRGLSQSFHVITAHAKANEDPKVPYEALVATGGTLVFLMGVSALAAIQKGLLLAGMDPCLPAAIVERGTHPAQRKVLAPLRDLAQAAQRASIVSPAIVIVGKVAALSESLDWFSHRPLHGKKVVVTRAREKASELRRSLEELGAQVLEVPSIKSRSLPAPADGAALWPTFGQSAQWLVFTSARGVQGFFEWLDAAALDARALSLCRFACVGRETALALKEHGLRADLVPQTYSGEALAQELIAQRRPEERVLILRAKEGSATLTEALTAAGIAYREIPVYETLWDPGAVRLEQASACDAITFASAATVEGFCRSYPTFDPHSMPAICIGEQTAKAARGKGFNPILSQKATMDSMAACVKEVLTHDDDPTSPASAQQ
ncbi:Uroporphyrinogen-III methyltransferase [Clostridiaceae bacterium JG1575]|nr:Uroporphyrinogen-III methyltransferase [Clostridiaceae bacterium JG1575]